MDFEIAIIGGGPAGLTAGLYAARARRKVVLFEGEGIGGQAATTDRVANYPGFPDEIGGFELTARMEEQAKKLGLEVVYSKVTGLSAENRAFMLETSKGNYTAKKVIVASGVSPKKLNVPGEDKFRGGGVSYCATCDGAFFRDKEVLVVGGGDSAVEEAIFLTRFAKQVGIVHRRDELRATKIVQEEAEANPKIKFFYNKVVTELAGGDSLEKAILKDVKSGTIEEVPTSGVFIYIGSLPRTEFLSGLVELTPEGYLATDERMRTSRPGLFAAGDVRAKSLRQIVTAVADGAIAAVEADRELGAGS
jgi:thioredoxin reductase (NADPH)